MYLIPAIFAIILVYFIYKGKKRYDKNKPPTTIYPIDENVKNSDFENEIINLINLNRIENKIKPLKNDLLVTKLAIGRVIELIEDKKISHDGFDNEPKLLISKGADGTGENIAFGYSNSKSLIEAYMKSHGHRLNILNKKWDAMGNAARQDNKGHWWYCSIFIYDKDN